MSDTEIQQPQQQQQGGQFVDNASQVSTADGHLEVQASEAMGAQVVPAGTPGAVPFMNPATGRTEYIQVTQAQQAPQGEQIASQGEQIASQGEQPAQVLQQQVNQALANDKVIEQDLASKGIDFNALGDEIDMYGELSPQSLQRLEQAGYPKQVVDAYIAGVEAQTQAFTTEVKSYVGGDKGWEQLVNFMKSQDDKTITSFNNLIMTGDLSQIKMCLEGITAKMLGTYGTSNPTVLGGQGATGKPSGFQTPEEMTTAIADPRYNHDMQYTQQVYQKIANAAFY